MNSSILKRGYSVALSRHIIREKALLSLFPLDVNEDLTQEAAIDFALNNGRSDDINEEESAFIPEYLDQIVSGVCDNKDELDKTISEHLNHFSINRIAKTDLIILRIALYEMQYVEDVPDKVALNEAIELSKKFSDDTSRKFVNGVLSNCIQDNN